MDDNSDWLHTTIGEQITLQRGFDITQKDHRAGNIPVISSGGINGYHDTAMAQGPGVITGRKGSLGTVYYVQSDYWPHDTTLWVRDFKGNHPRFVYYFLQTLDFLGMDVGSSNPTLNRNHIHPMEVFWPPLDEQRAIAHILGSLDGKIEANRRLNATLEASARALFKAWFVDFEPVHAKARGEAPAGMDAATAALFPDHFEASDLGMIPAGWRVGALGDVADINARSIGKNFAFEHIEYVDISSVSLGILEATTSYILEEAPSRARRIVEHGDTIWGTVRPNRKSYAFIHSPEPNMIASTGFAVLSPFDVPPAFLYAWVTTEKFVDYLVSNASGSAYPAVNAKRFAEAPMLIPAIDILEVFHSIVEPIRDQIAHNERESRTLAETRDALLPRLVGGALRVWDVDL